MAGALGCTRNVLRCSYSQLRRGRAARIWKQRLCCCCRCCAAVLRLLWSAAELAPRRGGWQTACLSVQGASLPPVCTGWLRHLCAPLPMLRAARPHQTIADEL